MQGEISADARILEANLINKLRTKCDTLFLVTHLKPYYRQNVDTGKEVPSQSKLLDRVCDVRLWIRQNSQSAVPIGLVIKRAALREIDDNGQMTTINFLPQKLTPRLDDTSLWNAIGRYAAKPMGNRVPTEDETPNELEMAILKNTLTEEQMRIYEYGVRLVVNGRRPEKQMVEADPMVAEIRELKSQGVAPPMIHQQLESKYPDLTIPMILGVS
jgi:hypothetical protein